MEGLLLDIVEIGVLWPCSPDIGVERFNGTRDLAGGVSRVAGARIHLAMTEGLLEEEQVLVLPIEECGEGVTEGVRGCVQDACATELGAQDCVEGAAGKRVPGPRDEHGLMRGGGPDGEPGAERPSGGRIEIDGAGGTSLPGADLDARGIMRELQIFKPQIGEIAQAKPGLETELDEGVIAPGPQGFRRWFRGEAAKLFGMGDRGGCW